MLDPARPSTALIAVGLATVAHELRPASQSEMATVALELIRSKPFTLANRLS